MDEASLLSEQIQKNKEDIHKLSRDFRLQATKLYLKIKQEEFDFQDKRLEKLLEDFPQDRDDKIEPSTQTITVNVEEENDEIFTQRPISTQKKESEVNGKGSKLYEKYVEFALKRAELETEREVHFLVRTRRRKDALRDRGKQKI